MQTDPLIPPLPKGASGGGAPLSLSACGPTTDGAIPPLITGPVGPPPLPPSPKTPPGRQITTLLLNLCLGLFLVEAAFSLLDDSVILLFQVHALNALRLLLAVSAGIIALAVYGLMGLTPMIPKRLFLPVTLYSPVTALGMLPLLIHHPDRAGQIAWGISLGQVLCGLLVLCRARGGLQFRWPLVPESRLGLRGFGWLNLTGFLLLNFLVVVPAVAVYLVFCAALAVGHFSDGFLALRPSGLAVQVRKYTRDDGKTILLVPMAHIGEADFYGKVARSFPSNSIILMEGVSDRQNLLTNGITYKRMAASLGLAEQQREFKPDPGRVVRADVDVGEFARSTIDFLNLAMRIHSRGPDPGTLQEMLQSAQAPEMQERLISDLLTKRNEHLLREIRKRLAESENLVVPWGAAHIPGIAREIQKSGFRVVETKDYLVIRFHHSRNPDEEAARKR